VPFLLDVAGLLLEQGPLGVHHRKMTNGTQATVIFCCQQCGACYQATQEQSPDRKSGRFDCQVCKTQVYAWSGGYNFFHWKAFEPNAQRHQAE
jgi:hypothetical protein